MKKMLAAVFEGEGKLNLKEVPVPEIKELDNVLLQVEAASICGTDVHLKERKRVGLLINFNVEKIKERIKRIILMGEHRGGGNQKLHNLLIFNDFSVFPVVEF